MSLAKTAVVLTGVSSYQGYKASKARGKGEKKSAYAEAAMLDKRADQEESYGRREAIEINRQKNITKSNAKASIAAGGGDASDVSALEIYGDIEKEFDYNAFAAIYQATEKAKDTRESAKVVRSGGRAAQSAYNSAAKATALRGVSETFTTFRQEYPDFGK